MCTLHWRGRHTPSCLRRPEISFLYVSSYRRNHRDWADRRAGRTPEIDFWPLPGGFSVYCKHVYPSYEINPHKYLLPRGFVNAKQLSHESLQTELVL